MAWLCEVTSHHLALHLALHGFMSLDIRG